MVTIKSYTDISQSKKLAEILPLESADMYYEKRCNLPEVIVGNYSLHMQCRATDKDYKKLTYPVLSPCWSLAALLDYLSTNFYVDIKYLDNYWELDCHIQVTYNKELIDACYEMILKLNELNLL